MIECISPVDSSVYVARDATTPAQLETAVAAAVRAQADWRPVALAERSALCHALVDQFVSEPDERARELAWQMGRPVRFGGGEVNGFAERARSMIEQAGAALADTPVPGEPGLHRFIRHEALGVFLTIAPWNYPYLTAVNSVIPALMAGNAVLLKHSHQTPLCGERIADAGRRAGLPDGLLQTVYLTRTQTGTLIADPRIAGVAFTGSVEGGRQVQQSAAGRFIPVGLELGGKDPAYVRNDADIEAAAASLADGAFFNSGQSCCGIERIYVQKNVYDAFIEALCAETAQLVLGNPLDPHTTLGPMVRTSAADFVRGQIRDAIAAGARGLIDPAGFPANQEDSPYLAPQILVDVDHNMAVMTEESFGPVVGVMPVNNDDQAIALMNDSRFGLTASIWSADENTALQIGDQLQTGTVFMNRCDYLDPQLAWTGVKDSGRGISLSALGYAQLTRAKSFHLCTGD